MSERIELKATETLAAITKLCNEGHRVNFVSDWGGNTLTVFVDDRHTHIGTPGCSEKFLIESLHSLFCKNEGLSWVKVKPEPPSIVRITEGFGERKKINPKEV